MLFMNKSFKEEEKYIITLVSEISDEKIELFVYNYLHYYIHKANINRIIYYITRVLEVMLPTICSAIVALSKCGKFNDCCVDNTTIILSSITTILLGLNLGAHCKEKWVRYRSAAEQCKIEIENYLIDGDFKNLKSYLNNFQDVHRAETTGWKIERSKKDDDK